MGQAVVMRAHAVLGAVATRRARRVHRVAAQRVGKRQLGASLEVGAVVHAGGKCRSGVSDALAADHVAHGVAKVGDVALDAVEHRVEALVGREARRHREHELGVDHRQAREQARLAQAKLLLGLLLRDDAAGVHLRAGAGRGGHAHERQRVVGHGQAPGRAALDEVPDVARLLGAVRGVVRVGGRGADALGAVHDRAAAQRQHEVAAALAGQPGAGVHRLAQRVRLDAVEELVGDARPVELGLDAGQVAVGLHRLARRGDNERLGSRQPLVSQLAQLTRAKEHARGCKEVVWVHGHPAFTRVSRLPPF